MDEFTKKMLEARRKEDEEFNTIMDARLKRQFAFAKAVRGKDIAIISDAIEEEEEEIYEVTFDEDGEIEVNKQED